MSNKGDSLTMSAKINPVLVVYPKNETLSVWPLSFAFGSSCKINPLNPAAALMTNNAVLVN